MTGTVGLEKVSSEVVTLIYLLTHQSTTHRLRGCTDVESRPHRQSSDLIGTTGRVKGLNHPRVYQLVHFVRQEEEETNVGKKI